MSQYFLICIGDGDDIGNEIDFYLLSNDLDNASKFSYKVKVSIEKIAINAQSEMAANIVYIAGDDLCFTVSSNNWVLEKLETYSKNFFKDTGKTISFGVAQTSTEAAMCLRKAKVSGKGCIVASGV